MKLALVVALVLAGGSGIAAAADESPWTLSGNVSLTSDYIFRGFTQTQGDPAIQGTLTLTHESGFYLGLFGSNVDFGDGATDTEIDVFAGYHVALDDKTGFDIAAYYYGYPREPSGADYGYYELVAAFAHDFGVASITLRTALTPQFFGQTDAGVWVSAGVSAPLRDWLSLSANAGYQWIGDNAKAGLPDYFHYDAGATATFKGVSLDVRYFGADADGAVEKVVGTIGFSF